MCYDARYMLLIIALASFLSTLLGGLFALKLKDKLHLILGFSAGAVVGVAFFDLIPEALEIGSVFYSISTVTAVIALGFASYLILDRVLVLHSHDDHHDGHRRGIFGAGSLSVHSFLDGLGIGLAFHVSPAVGVIVAVAVLTHDFSDGINTVSMIIKNGGKRADALRWLLVDALSPVLGIIATLFFTIPLKSLGLLLALFAGFFLYIGASDLLPESHHAHPVMFTTLATVCGMACMYGVIFASGL